MPQTEKDIHKGDPRRTAKGHEARRNCFNGTRRSFAARRPPPHRISLRLPARLLRLPLKGGVIPKACIRSSSITPPLRGSRREGGARSTRRPVEPEGGKRGVPSSRRGANAASRRAGGGQTRRPVEPEGGKRGAPSSRRGANAAPHNSHGRTGYTRLPLGVRRPVILGSRKPAPDHRRSQLSAQQPLVLFILFILCIDVHKKISIPRRRPGSPRRISLRLPARLLRLPLQRGSDCPRERGRPARMLFPMAVAEPECDAAGSHPVEARRLPPTASAFACGSASATPPQGGQLQGL